MTKTRYVATLAALVTAICLFYSCSELTEKKSNESNNGTVLTKSAEESLGSEDDFTYNGEEDTLNNENVDENAALIAEMEAETTTDESKAEETELLAAKTTEVKSETPAPKPKAEPKPAPKPKAKPKSAPKPKAEPKPKAKPKPAPKPKAKPKPAPKPKAKPKPAPKPKAKPKPAPKPKAKPKPAPKPKAKPKPAPKPAPKLKATPEPVPPPSRESITAQNPPNTDAQRQVLLRSQPQTMSTQTTPPPPPPQPNSTPNSRQVIAQSQAVNISSQPRQPAPKAEPKPAPKPKVEPKPAPKPKAAPKPAPKPKAAPKPAPKPKAKPKPAPKPKAKPKPAPKPKAKPKAKSKKGGAAIMFKSRTYDFGLVNEGDKVTHVFPFKNTGGEPLIIKDANSSCGCTVPAYPKHPIMPGEDANIKVVFDTTGKLGSQNKTVTIKTNGKPSTATVAMKGFVTTPPPDGK